MPHAGPRSVVLEAFIAELLDRRFRDEFLGDRAEADGGISRFLRDQFRLSLEGDDQRAEEKADRASSAEERMRGRQGKGYVARKGISRSAQRVETAPNRGNKKCTYEASGGPRRSNDVEEGWISNLMVIGPVKGQPSFDSALLYATHRSLARPSERRTSAKWRTRISVAASESGARHDTTQLAPALVFLSEHKPLMTESIDASEA